MSDMKKKEKRKK